MTKLLTTAELEEATKAVPYPRKPSAAERAEWDAKISELEKQWEAWLIAEKGKHVPVSLRNEFFDKAWEDGHADGYYAVETAYVKYAEFAQDAIEAYLNERG